MPKFIITQALPTGEDRRCHHVSLTEKGQLVFHEHSRKDLLRLKNLQQLGGTACQCLNFLQKWRNNATASSSNEELFSLRYDKESKLIYCKALRIRNKSRVKCLNFTNQEMQIETDATPADYAEHLAKLLTKRRYDVLTYNNAVYAIVNPDFIKVKLKKIEKARIIKNNYQAYELPLDEADLMLLLCFVQARAGNIYVKRNDFAVYNIKNSNRGKINWNYLLQAAETQYYAYATSSNYLRRNAKDVRAFRARIDAVTSERKTLAASISASSSLSLPAGRVNALVDLRLHVPNLTLHGAMLFQKELHKIQRELEAIVRASNIRAKSPLRLPEPSLFYADETMKKL